MPKMISDYLSNLNERVASTDQQHEAIGVLTYWLSIHPECLPIVMQKGSKDMWYCQAIIVSAQSDAVIERYLGELLYWILDMNWPGAEIIANRLLVFSGDLLDQYIDDALRIAQDNICWTNSLAELIRCRKLGYHDIWQEEEGI